MKPFLAWVGSKSRIATDILTYLKSENFDVYIEPFLGSGSIGLIINVKEVARGKPLSTVLTGDFTPKLRLHDTLNEFH